MSLELLSEDPTTVVEAAQPWLRGLNDSQRTAVEHRGSHLLVVAGAGSGKTRTLASRAASLISDGVDPQRILLLTFTRRAAQEMLARTKAMVGSDRPARLTGGTFHAIANHLLREHARALGLHDGFTVLDDSDAVDVLSAVRREVLDGRPTARRFPQAGTLAGIMSRVANAQAPLSRVLREDFPWCADHGDAIRLVFGGYAARKRHDNVVDFDDLLLHWRALTADPVAGDHLRGRWDHVLVDEYQDVNAIQADIVHALGTPVGDGPSAQVTAVGDDAQAIYGFRDASAAHILSFADRHEGARVIVLDRSYRCSAPILEVANALTEQAVEKHPKTLWTTRTGGARPRLVTTHDEADQSRVVCDGILEARERGIALRQQAVLYRTATHANALEIELGRRDIPYVKFGGLKFLERAHVKDLHALLRLLDNPGDRLAWHRVLRLGEGVGPSWEHKLLTQLGVGTWRHEDGFDRSPLTRFLAAGLNAPAATQPFLTSLRTAWSTCLEPAASASPAMQVDALRPVCALVWPFHHLDHEARLADLDRLAVAASAQPSRGAFLADLTLDPPNGTGDLAGPPHLDDDWLTLSTIHSAKGLQWRAVHLIHAADGNLPSDMALRDTAGLDEERRLTYVAVSRARDELTITVPLRYHKANNGLGDQHTIAQMSRFLTPLRALFDESATTPSAMPVHGSFEHPIQPVQNLLDGLWAS